MSYINYLYIEAEEYLRDNMPDWDSLTRLEQLDLITEKAERTMDYCDAISQFKAWRINNENI
jgi:hypothetical protein